MYLKLEEIKSRDMSMLEGTKWHEDVKWLIAQAKKVERYEEFIRRCRIAGEGGLPRLKQEANQILKR